MDTRDIIERIEDLENQCCHIYFYSVTRPVTGKQKVLYIEQDTGAMSIWTSGAYVDL